jgi:hypothetical protein
MELFIPTLLIIVLAAFFAFLIIPRVGPMILAITCLFALLAAGIHHYNLFKSEYALSTWQYGLASYASIIVLGLAILAIIGAIYYLFTGGEAKASIVNAITTPMEKIQNAVANSAINMPAANTATNPVTAALNKGITAVSNVASSIPIPNLGGSSAGAPSGNKPNKNISPIIPGLGYGASQV